MTSFLVGFFFSLTAWSSISPKAYANLSQKHLPTEVLLSELQSKEIKIDLVLGNGKKIFAKGLVYRKASQSKQPEKIDGSIAMSPQSLPVILLFGGFEDAENVINLIVPNVPCVIISFDYPFAPPRKLKFPGSLAFVPDARQAIRDTREGISLLLRKVVEHPEMDATRISIVGASFGAPFAILAATDHVAIGGLVLVHAFADVPAVIQHRLKQVWGEKWRFRSLVSFSAWIFSRLLWWAAGLPNLESEIKKLRPQQKVLLISADQDSFIPKKVRDSLWDALENSPAFSDRVATSGGHLMPGSGPLIQKLLKISTAWMLEKGLL